MILSSIGRREFIEGSRGGKVVRWEGRGTGVWILIQCWNGLMITSSPSFSFWVLWMSTVSRCMSVGGAARTSTGDERVFMRRELRMIDSGCLNGDEHTRPDHSLLSIQKYLY